jgi:hypothetical protein
VKTLKLTEKFRTVHSLIIQGWRDVVFFIILVRGEIGDTTAGFEVKTTA